MQSYDTIEVLGLEFLGKHGVYDDERRDGRHYTVDLEADVARADGGGVDAIGQTLDYRDLAQIVVDVMAGPSVHLIETLGQTICARVLGEQSAVLRVRVHIRKRATGVPGDPVSVGVRFRRAREDA
jgi:7,8-dihydroneopterin aldolase/epimerase/oxygenase